MDKVSLNPLLHNCPSYGHRIRGLSLLEVLIALLVLSIGLVGLAALHINSVKSAHSSYYRSIASSLALDFEERLWLAVAAHDEGCLDVDAVDDVMDELETHWARAGAFVAIPALEVERTAYTTDAGEQWTEVLFNVSWTDERHGDNGEEVFQYLSRVICRLPGS